MADVAAQLQALLVTSSGPGEALVRLRGAQGAYFKNGWLVSFRPPLIPSDSGLVPLGPHLDTAVAARLRRLCDPRSTAAMALFLIADLRSHRLVRLDIGDIDDDGGAVAHHNHRFIVPDYARSLIRAQIAERIWAAPPPPTRCSFIPELENGNRRAPCATSFAPPA